MGSQGSTAAVCQILESSQRRNLSYLSPQLGYLKSAVRSRSFENVRNKHGWSCQALRACSHEPGTVNYPGVMIAPGQELPRVHMMVCCPGATLPRVNFIAPGHVHRHLITTKLSEFL